MDNISLWKDLIKTCLGKSSVKHSILIILDIKCVACGVKPSFLFDVTTTNAQSLASLLEVLYEKHLLVEKLFVIVIEDDVFVYHKQHLLNHLEHLGDTLVINASFNLASPYVLPREEGSSKISRISSITRNMLTCNSESIVHLDFPADINRTTAFGVMLGYPVIYWYDTQCTQENCLAMVPLCQIKVHCKVQVKEDLSHVPYSFSYPHSCQDDTRFVIEHWKQMIQDKIENVNIFAHLTFHLSTLSLPAVAM